MEITIFEIVLAMTCLLMVLLITIASHWAIGIIAFAILYHTFMHVRRKKIVLLDKDTATGE